MILQEGEYLEENVSHGLGLISETANDITDQEDELVREEYKYHWMLPSFALYTPAAKFKGPQPSISGSSYSFLSLVNLSSRFDPSLSLRRTQSVSAHSVNLVIQLPAMPIITKPIRNVASIKRRDFGFDNPGSNNDGGVTMVNEDGRDLGGGISAGAIAAIVVGTLFLFLIGTSFVWCMRRQYRYKPQSHQVEMGGIPPGYPHAGGQAPQGGHAAEGEEIGY